MSNKRILVTGGAGFIGSHLCRELLKQGNTVICLDDLSTGATANIEELLEHPRFLFMRGDVTMALPLKAEEIYNLACPASPVHYQRDPVKTVKTCVVGAINVLEMACTTEAKVLQASTSEVYGDPLVHPQKEDYFGNVNPVGKRSCYDEGKRCAETIFMDYGCEYRLDIKIARIFNTYGPQMLPNDGRVVSNFIVQALKGEDITIYGRGDQTRSFCYIDDLVDGLIRLMNTEAGFTGPVNLGNDNEFTVRELACRVKELTNSPSKLVFMPLPQDDPRRRQPDLALARSKLGWQPKVSLDDGLKVTVDYFRRQLALGKERSS